MNAYVILMIGFLAGGEPNVAGVTLERMSAAECHATLEHMEPDGDVFLCVRVDRVPGTLNAWGCAAEGKLTDGLWRHECRQE